MTNVTCRLEMNNLDAYRQNDEDILSNVRQTVADRRSYCPRIATVQSRLKWSTKHSKPQLHCCLHTHTHVSSMQRLGLSCTSILIHLHCLQMNFWNSSAGFLLNSVYSLSLPPWPSKLCTLIAHHIFLTSCNIMNLRGLCAHPVLISS